MVDDLRHVVLDDAVRDVHAAARAARCHEVCARRLDVVALAVVDLTAHLIVRHAEGAAGAAAAVMLFHLNELQAWNGLQDFARLFRDAKAANHVARIVHRDLLVDRTQGVRTEALLDEKFADLSYLRRHLLGARTPFGIVLEPFGIVLQGFDARTAGADDVVDVESFEYADRVACELVREVESARYMDRRAAAVLLGGQNDLDVVRLENVDDGIAHVRVHVVDRAAREEGDAELGVRHLDDLGILAAQWARGQGRGRAVRIHARHGQARLHGILARHFLEGHPAEHAAELQRGIEERAILQETEDILLDRVQTARLDSGIPAAQDQLVSRDAARTVRRAALAVQAHRHDVVKFRRDGNLARKISLHQRDLAARDHLLFFRLAVDRTDGLAVAAFHAVRQRVLDVREERCVLLVQVCRRKLFRFFSHRSALSNQFARVQNEVRVECALDLAHGLHAFLAVLQLHPGQLAEADAVLARERAAELDRTAEDVVHRLVDALRLLLVAQVADDRRVHVAVACMTERADRDVVILCRLLDDGEECRNLASRHGRIFDERRRTQLRKARKRHAASRPELFLVFRVAGKRDLACVVFLQNLHDLVRLVLDDHRMTVDLDEEDRVSVRRQADVHEVLDRADRRVVKNFERRRDDLRGDDARDGASRILDSIEDRDHALRLLRRGNELQESLRDDAERAFRTREELRHVVARDILDVLAARMQHIAVREDDFETLHIVLRDAVFETAQAARVFCDRAAEARRLDRARIGRVDEAELRDMVVDVLHDDARLDLGDEVFEIDVDNPIEAEHREDDAALQRRRARREIRAGTARVDGDLVLVRDLQDLRDFLRRAGADDDVRHVDVAWRSIIGVGVKFLFFRLNIIRADDFRHFFYQLLLFHLVCTSFMMVLVIDKNYREINLL